MEKVLLEASARDGKVIAKRLRKDGKVAGVVYGKETKSMPVEIKIKDLEKTVKTLSEGSLLITLKLTDKDKSEEKIVVIREIQRDPVTEEIIHADFHQISEKEKATFKVPVHTVGIPEGVKLGGILELVTRDVAIRCLPKDLPARFEMDVSALMIGKSVSLADLKMPEGVEIMDDKTKTVAAVVAPHKEEEAKPAEGAAVAGAEGAAPAEPELIKKERASDEEGAEGAEKKGADKKAAPAKEEKKK
jgi:large subunit ribosomal protein L25